MGAPLQYKARVRVRTDLPLSVEEPKNAPVAVPIAAYWLASGALMVAISTGRVSVESWFAPLREIVTEAPSEPAAPRRRAAAVVAAAPARPARAAPAAVVPAPVVRAPFEPAHGAMADVTVTTNAPVNAPVFDSAPPGFESAPRVEVPPRAPTSEPEPQRVAAVTDYEPWRPEPDVESPAMFPERKRRGPASTWLGPETPRAMARDESDPLRAFDAARKGPARAAPSPAVAARSPQRDAPQREPSAPPQRHAPPRSEPPPAVYGSCEAAMAAASDSIDLSSRGKRVPDLPREAFSRVLDDGRYLSPCGVPESMTVGICAAIQNGRVVGVTVTTSPRSSRVQACVTRAVRGLSFPSNPRLDVARTRFAP